VGEKKGAARNSQGKTKTLLISGSQKGKSQVKTERKPRKRCTKRKREKWGDGRHRSITATRGELNKGTLSGRKRDNRQETGRKRGLKESRGGGGVTCLGVGLNVGVGVGWVLDLGGGGGKRGENKGSSQKEKGDKRNAGRLHGRLNRA